MIIDSKGMKEIESASGFTPYELMEKAGYKDVYVLQDLGGHDRVVVGTKY